MKFDELKLIIKSESQNISNSFDESSEIISSAIFALDKQNIIELTKEIGAIPEDISHDSTEEKLYSKATDILLAKIFHELGFQSIVNKERANCADVIVKSQLHGYTFVADAKAFRLSRTAKNQKDFKVKSMLDWKGDNDYSVLVCPYYQYPKSNSQIYGQALFGNVCLLSWEHLAYLLEKGIQETVSLNLNSLWNISDKLSESVAIKDKDLNINFHQKANKLICDILGLEYEDFQLYLNSFKSYLIARCESEISFWEEQIQIIQQYSKAKAITELITALKLNEKITAINKYIKSLRT